MDLERDGLAVVQEIELLAVKGDRARRLIDVNQRLQKAFGEIWNRADRARNDRAAGDERNADIVERRIADIRIVDHDDVLEAENFDRRGERLIREDRECRKLRLGIVESPRRIWLPGNGIVADTRDCNDLGRPEVL